MVKRDCVRVRPVELKFAFRTMRASDASMVQTSSNIPCSLELLPRFLWNLTRRVPHGATIRVRPEPATQTSVSRWWKLTTPQRVHVSRAQLSPVNFIRVSRASYLFLLYHSTDRDGSPLLFAMPPDAQRAVPLHTGITMHRLWLQSDRFPANF